MPRLAWQVYALDADLTDTGVIWSRTGAKQTCVLCPERPPPTMQLAPWRWAPVPRPWPAGAPRP